MGSSQTVVHNSGTGTFVVPNGVNFIQVETWGAGGRGGTRTTNGTSGGGGGGAYSRSTIFVTPGQTLYYSVGTGSSNNANPGGDTWLSTSPVVGDAIVLAKGGNTVPNNTQTGATGGAQGSGIGTVRFSGGNGANGVAATSGGGGGSSAGSSAAGNNGVDRFGGMPPIGGGIGGNGALLNSNGLSGSSPGSGGGGVYRSSSTRTGGNGTNGRIAIHLEAFAVSGFYTWTVPQGVNSIEVELWGGGGRGGSRTSDGGGGGGGGGAYSKSLISVNPGQTYYINVGAGSNTTSAGGTSWFSETPFAAGALVLAVGGSSVGNNTTGGASGGAAASGIGDVTNSGGNGAASASSNGGGGGASAGSAGAGANASGITGGIATSGGGNGGDGRPSGTPGPGFSGDSPGGGGGGSRRNGAPDQSGGNGADGKVNIRIQSYASPGSVYEWVAPAGVTQIEVEAWGGGGRGGQRGNNGRGGGGGGGGYSRSTLTVVPGNTYYINVGSGSTDTNPGGDSWFSTTNVTSGSLVRAKGGNSAPNNSNNGATGGAATGGTNPAVGAIRYSGGDGANSSGSATGGGGSSAGISSNGTNGTAPTGGVAPNGGGNGADGHDIQNTPGNPGFEPGGGGSGARRNAGTVLGGAGANGKVSIKIIDADVAVTQTVSNITPMVLDEVTIVVSVTNFGSQTATNVNVVDILASGFAGTGLQQSKGTIDIMNSTWEVGTLTVNETATLEITAIVNPTGPYTNTATISANESDLDLSNNESVVTVFPIVPTSNLSIIKEVDNTTPEIGTEINFSLTAYNSGPDDATNVVVTDLLPSGFTYVSHSGGTYDDDTGVWDIGNLNSGSTVTLIIEATVEATGSFTNIAEIEGDQFDPVETNITSEITIYPMYPMFEVILPCSTVTYDLENLLSQNLPPNATVSWHTDTPADENNLVDDISEAFTARLYYISFYDNIDDCYGPTVEVFLKRSCLITNPMIHSRFKSE